MAYKFKELILEDLDIVINKYITYHNSEGGKWTYDLAKKSLEQTFLAPGYYGIGLYDECEMVGFAMGCFKQYDDILLYYLDEILVFKEHQNKGLGTKILQELELLVKERGAEKIDLSTTYEENHQRFYSKLGFKKSDFLIPMFKRI